MAELQKTNAYRKVIAMKKTFLLFMVLVMVCTSWAFPAMAAEDASLLVDSSAATNEDGPISVMLDGEYIQFDVQPTLINDRTMVPVRAIFEALGATVDWIDDTQTVVSSMGDTNIKMNINDKVLLKNGQPIELDVPAQLVGKRTLVPVRAISEAYDCFVDWNGWNNTVVIVSDLSKVPVATVNGENISMGYFNFVLCQVEAYAMQAFDFSAEDLKNIWTTSLGSTTFGEYLVATTLEQCVYTKANAMAAKAKGIGLGVADKNSMNAQISSLVEGLGGSEQAVVDGFSTTMSAMAEFYTDNKYAEKYYDMLTKEAQMSEKEPKKYLDDNYIRAKHILFTTVDTNTGMPLSEKEIASKKELAQATLQKIRNGQNFDNLMKSLSEDPGSKAAPEGYLFTKGEMVSEFETAAFALKVGNVSGIVESTYGYHIIKRVPNGTYTSEDIAKVKTELVDNKVNATMDANKASAKIESNANMLKNIVPLS